MTMFSIPTPPYMPQKVHERAVRAFHAKRWWGHRLLWGILGENDYCAHCSLKLMVAADAIMEGPWFGEPPTRQDYENLRDWILDEYEEKAKRDLAGKKMLRNYADKSPEEIRSEFLKILREELT